MAITGEYKVKKQKNGNQHFYIYYHCTHKSKTIKCNQPCVRQEVLNKQISTILQKFSLKQDWAEELTARLEKDKNKSAQTFDAFVQDNKKRIAEIQIKLQRLLDGYLEQDIEREIYREEKAKLLSEKKTLEEKISGLEQKRIGWIEPMRNWIKEAENNSKIANENDLFRKKVACRNIFGSNLILLNREAASRPPSETNSPSKTHWVALCAATKNFKKSEKSLIVERVGGVEPPSLAWKAKVIPIYDTRIYFCRGIGI